MVNAGIEDLVDKRPTKLENFRAGHIYNTGLIIERDGHNMVTVRKVDDEIQVERHIIKVDGDSVSIKFDGGQEYYPHNPEYASLDKKLKEAGIPTLE